MVAEHEVLTVVADQLVAVHAANENVAAISAIDRISPTIVEHERVFERLNEFDRPNE